MHTDLKPPSPLWNSNWPNVFGKYLRMLPDRLVKNVYWEAWPTWDDLNHFCLNNRDTEDIGLPYFAPHVKKTGRLKMLRGENVDPGPRIGGYHHYDQEIILKNMVPTRPCNWHDFFNFVIWLSFPQAKFALHRLSYNAANEYLKTHSNNRSRINDLSTLFDEAGIAVVISDQELYDEIVFNPKPPLESLASANPKVMHCAIFGHALLESIYCNKAEITAFALILRGSPLHKPIEKNADYLRYFDNTISAFLSQSEITEKDFKKGSFALKNLL